MVKFLVAAASAAVFCATAQAGDHLYIQANAGSPSSDLSSCYSTRSGFYEVANCSIKGQGGKLLAGYRVMPSFALEATYWKLGTDHAVDSVGQVDGKITAFGLGGAFHFGITEDWSGVARFGFARVKTRLSYLDNGTTTSVDGDSESHAKYYAGGGIIYSITPVFKLHGDFDYTKVRSNTFKEHGMRLLSLGGSVNF